MIKLIALSPLLIPAAIAGAALRLWDAMTERRWIAQIVLGNGKVVAYRTARTKMGALLAKRRLRGMFRFWQHETKDASLIVARFPR